MKTRDWLILGAALVIGATLGATPASALDISEEQTMMHDTWLTAKTKIALAADGRVKGRQIDVETTGGRVMLRGMVDSDAARQAAEEIVQGLDGVTSVKNDLSAGHHDQCPSVLDRLASARREGREE